MKLIITISILFLTTFHQVKALNTIDSLSVYLQSKIDSFPNNTYISIALIKQDSVHYIGISKTNDSTVTLSLEDSLFEIGSVTKVFTSTLLAKQLHEGNIKNKAIVNTNFDYKFHDKIKLSYISLANHTSGLTRLPSNILPIFYKNPNNPYQDYTYKLLDEYLENDLQLEDNKKPTYSYSNLGTGLLAYSLCKKENLEFEELLERDIFNKFKMNATSYQLKPSFNGLNAEGEIATNWTFNSLKGAGGLVSSASDLVNFIQAQFFDSNIILSLSRTETHKISEKMSIGLGWHILYPNSKDEKYWHNGGTGGFTSSVAFRTSNKTGVVVLSNISPSNKFGAEVDKICFELLDAIK